MATVTISIDERQWAQARAQAETEGMSVEEWLQRLIQRSTSSSPYERPRDPLFGLLANEPDLADAIDGVVAERRQSRLRVP